MLTYNIEKHEERALIAFEGRIDNEGTSVFQESLEKLFDLDASKVVFNFSNLIFINSSGIGKLLLFYKKYKNKGGDIVISGINDDVYTLFKAIRLDKLIVIER